MKPLLLFDFDGVICDSVKTLHTLIQDHFDPTISWEDLQQIFEEHFSDGMKKRNISLNQGDLFSKIKEDIIHKSPDNWGTLFPFIEEVLTELSQRYTLIIITSNQHIVIERILEHNNLSDIFHEILSRDLPGNKTHKIKKLHERHPQYAPDKTFLISDSLGDINEAHEAGIRSIGVTWGIHPHETLKKGKPAHICSTPEELLKLLP